jgi:hypothetical protein
MDLRDYGGAPPERGLEQRWVLASAGVLTEMNRASHLRIGGSPRLTTSYVAAHMLRRDWGIFATRGLVEKIDWLFDRGHRFDFAERSEHGVDELCAWDLVRAANLAGAGYLAYMLEAEQAWSLLVRAARQIQATFRSWAEVGASYRLGRRLWGGDSEDVDLALEALLAKGGAWDLPWDVDLSRASLPSAESLPTLVVDASGADGAYTTINAAMHALEATTSAGRIVVREGRYEERVALLAPCELVAEGRVVLHGGKGAPIVAFHEGGVVRGFELESSEWEGVAMQCVWTHAWFLKLEDCTMRSARCGVYAHGGAASHTVVERCVVEAAEASGFLADDDAHLVVVDARVSGARHQGIATASSGELRVESTRIEHAGRLGIAVTGTGVAELVDVEVVASGAHGVEVSMATQTTIVGARIHGSAQVGLLATGEGHGALRLVDCEIVNNGTNALAVLPWGSRADDAKTFADVLALRCTLRSPLGSALVVSRNGRARIVESSLESGASGVVVVDTGGVARLDRCLVDSSGGVGVWVKPDARAYLGEVDVRAKELGAYFDGSAAIEWEGGSVEAAQSAVFARGCRSAALRGVRLVGGSPAVCSQHDSDLVLVDCEVRCEGAMALLIERAALALTRTEVHAPNGKAIGFHHGEANVLGGSLRGQVLADELEGSIFRVSGTTLEGSIERPPEEVQLAADALAPGRLCLLTARRLGLELPHEVLAPALAVVGLEQVGRAYGPWVDALLRQSGLGTLELEPSDSVVTVAHERLDVLERVADAVRSCLVDTERCEQIGAEVHALFDPNRTSGDDDEEDDPEESDPEESDRSNEDGPPDPSDVH